MNYTRAVFNSIFRTSRTAYVCTQHANSKLNASAQLHPLPWASHFSSSRVVAQHAQLHTSALLSCIPAPIYPKFHPEISKFHRHNYKKYPPLKPGEAPRHAFVCHEKRNVRYHPKKMQVVAKFIRGMSIEDAINQLKFVALKGAVDILETLLEAQKMAVTEHNVEFPSNLWVSESFCLSDKIVKTIRRHSKARVGIIHHRYVHYCCTLEEGKPPKHYYPYNRRLEPQEHIEQWLQEKREKDVPFSI